MQSFEVETEDVLLERTYPFAFALVLHYHALRHGSFYTGPGYELEAHENLFLMKIGTEYGFELSENFENKQNVYDAWTFGIAFNKKLWEKK